MTCSPPCSTPPPPPPPHTLPNPNSPIHPQFEGTSNIADATWLASLAGEVGLPVDQAAAIMDCPDVEMKVATEAEKYRAAFNITGVPFFIMRLVPEEELAAGYSEYTPDTAALSHPGSAAAAAGTAQHPCREGACIPHHNSSPCPGGVCARPKDGSHEDFAAAHARAKQQYSQLRHSSLFECMQNATLGKVLVVNGARDPDAFKAGFEQLLRCAEAKRTAGTAGACTAHS